jgi:hypothetical protein
MTKLKTVMSGTPTVYFIKFVPYAPKEVIDAQYVQCITVSGSSKSEDELRSAIEGFKSVAGCFGAASGQSLSEVNGTKVFVAVVGWESLDASKAGQSAHAVDVGGSVEHHHVNFRFPVKGFRGL